MKQHFTVTIITVLLSISVHCQELKEIRRLLDQLEVSTLGRKFSRQPTETQGSPYLNKWFAPAKVVGVVKNAYMRYDVYNDEFEFINSKNDTLLLNKEERFNSITFTVTNTTYQLVNYTNNSGKMILGYLICLYEKNDFILYKKQRISYYKEKIAKTSFETNSPPKFLQERDIFYWKNKDKGISEFPSNRKGLLKLFPEKKIELETFIKQNAIDFDKETDMMKIIDFLAL